MAFPVFSPSVNPSFPLKIDHTFRVNRVQFGGGYAQTAPDGLNAHERKITLNWTNITAAERAEIVAFMVAREGSEPFTITLDGVSYTLKASGLSETKTTANAYEVNVECEQVFDLE